MIRAAILMGVTGAILLIAEGLTLRAESSIELAARSITTDAAPSIERLAEARSELRNYQRLLDDYVDRAAEGDAPDRQALQAAIVKIDRALEEYLALPSYPGERAAFLSIQSTRTEMDGLARQCFVAVDNHDMSRALDIEKRQIDPLIEVITARILDVSQLNAREADALAIQITQTHERTVYLAWVVGVFSIAMFLAVSAWTARRIRRGIGRLDAARTSAENQVTMLNQFSGMVAHDVIGPLQATSIALELAERLHPGDEMLRRHITLGRRGLKQTMDLVRGLLEFARSHGAPAQGRSTPLSRTAAEVAEILAPELEANRIDLRLEGACDASVNMDKGALTSVVLNLLRNASKFMGDSQDRQIWLRTVGGKEFCGLFVEDTGPGIPPGMEEAIFEPYVRGPNEKAPGYGIGLATVKRLVTSFGGTIRVRRGRTGGACFEVQLPVSRQAPPPEKKEGPRPTRSDAP